MNLYLCEYEDGINNRTLYYFAGGGNFHDTKIHKFTYKGYCYTNDDGDEVLDDEITKEMTFEEMNKYIIQQLIKKGRSPKPSNNGINLRKVGLVKRRIENLFFNSK